MNIVDPKLLALATQHMEQATPPTPEQQVTWLFEHGIPSGLVTWDQFDQPLRYQLRVWYACWRGAERIRQRYGTKGRAR